jgi:putative toxin-antitoxin system antitoxin component (TIGR02293 family)
MRGVSAQVKAVVERPEIQEYRRAIKGGGAGEYSFVALVGLRPQNPIEIRKRVVRGFAFEALERFQRNTGLSTSDLADAGVITIRTRDRRKEQGRLQPEESDRLLRVSRVFGKTLELFEGDFAGARQWLASPQPGLRGERPILLANTDVGAREVEALIARLEHGVLT